jgi:mono/diheme cytochrome c family protein
LLGLSSPAFAQEVRQVDAGKAVWQNGGCGGCHGANGAGGTNPDQPAGPALRNTALDRAALVEKISCGVPGTQMAAWLRGAYTESGCYGGPSGPAPAGTMVIGAFSAEEIGALVDYIEVEFNGR